MEPYIAEDVMRTQSGSVFVHSHDSYSPLSAYCARKASRRASLRSATLPASAKSPASAKLTAICPPSSGMTSMTMPAAI